MKSTKKETVCRVSDRAYRIIISDVIDSMTGCKIDPFTFKQVVTAVRHYLKPEGKPTGLGRKAKVIFDRLLPDLDRAIRRSETARAAAARRKEAAKKTAEAEAAEVAAVKEEKPEPAVKPERPDAGTQKPAPETGIRPTRGASRRIGSAPRHLRKCTGSAIAPQPAPSPIPKTITH